MLRTRRARAWSESQSHHDTRIAVSGDRAIRCSTPLCFESILNRALLQRRVDGARSTARYRPRRLQTPVAVAEMHRRGATEPCRADPRLDFNGLVNWQEDCMPQISERTVAAVGISLSLSSHFWKHVRAARYGSLLSRLREKSIKTTSVQSLSRFGTRCGWTAGPLSSSVLARIEWGRAG